MVRSIAKSKAINNTLATAVAGAGIGIFGSTLSTLGTDQNLLDCVTDIAVSTTACSLIPAFIAAPIYMGLDAFQEVGFHEDRVARFGHTLHQNTLDTSRTVTWQPENKEAMKQLLQSHWCLHTWKSRYEKLSNIEEGFPISVVPCIGAPLCVIFMYQHYNLEMFAAGMTLNYAGALAAFVQKKLRSHKIQKAIDDCTFFDEKAITPEFVAQHTTMVAKMCDQFQPIHANYKNHTVWSAREIEKKGQFYYPNINEQIQAFDVVMESELENFKVL